jgi:hypothetical protein
MDMPPNTQALGQIHIELNQDLTGNARIKARSCGNICRFTGPVHSHVLKILVFGAFCWQGARKAVYPCGTTIFAAARFDLAPGIPASWEIFIIFRDSFFVSP